MNCADFLLAFYVWFGLLIFFAIVYLAEKFVFKTNFWKKILRKFEEI